MDAHPGEIVISLRTKWPSFIEFLGSFLSIFGDRGGDLDTGLRALSLGLRGDLFGVGELAGGAGGEMGLL